MQTGSTIITGLVCRQAVLPRIKSFERGGRGPFALLLAFVWLLLFPVDSWAADAPAFATRGLSQYYVDNSRAGRLLVITGEAVNLSGRLRSHIQVEATLYDSANRVLLTKTAAAGTTLQLFELQSFSFADIEAELGNSVIIEAVNSNIPHGGSIPFMLVFRAPSGSLRTYAVRLYDASEWQPARPDGEGLEALTGKLEVHGLQAYYADNPDAGHMLVLEGFVRNGFDEERELIQIRAELFDAAGNSLASKSQLAGGSLSLEQLQRLPRIELDRQLTSRIHVLHRNINIHPGDTVPFMLLFYQPPAKTVSFDVQVIDARRPRVELPTLHPLPR